MKKCMAGLPMLLVLTAIMVNGFSGVAAAAPSFIRAADQCQASSPVLVLHCIQVALDKGDTELFERSVDLDALVGAAVDFFLEEGQTPAGKERLSPVVAMFLSSVGDSPKARKTLQTLVSGEARNFVIYGVQSGSFAGKLRPNVPAPGGVLAPLFADASLGRKEIQQVGQARPAGRDSLVSFVVHDYGNGISYPVTGRMRPISAEATDGAAEPYRGWRLVQVENLPQLADQVRRESLE